MLSMCQLEYVAMYSTVLFVNSRMKPTTLLVQEPCPKTHISNDSRLFDYSLAFTESFLNIAGTLLKIHICQKSVFLLFSEANIASIMT